MSTSFQVRWSPFSRSVSLPDLRDEQVQPTPFRHRHREQLVPFDRDEKQAAMQGFLAERKNTLLGRHLDRGDRAIGPTPTVSPNAPQPALPAPDCGPQASRPTVLIMSSNAGTGHQAAAQAIDAALTPTYNVVVVRPFDFDFAIPGLGAIEGADLYNMVQAHGPPLCLDMMGGAQRWLTPIEDVLHTHHLNTLMSRYKPDLIISVVPMGSSTVSKMARDRHIPMIVVPTDLDFAHFVHAIEDPGPYFKLALPFPQLRIQAPHLPETAFATTGYPLRKEFCTRSGLPTGTTLPLLERLQITAQCRVVMIMMGGGGVGGDRILAHALSLGQGLGPEIHSRADRGVTQLNRHQRVHVVCMCGRNQKVKLAIEELFPPRADTQIRVHALEGCAAEEVAALMQRAGVLITKPGGATVNEALACNVWQLFDKTVHVPHWELGNATYTTDHHMGEWLDPQSVVQKVVDILSRGPAQRPLQCPSLEFPQTLHALVTKLITTKQGAGESAPWP